LNNHTILVFSRTLDSAPWGTTGSAEVVKPDDLATEFTQRKAEPGGDMVLIGSAGLARACIAAGVVDEYWLYLNPVILGEGMPLFAPHEPPIDLDLVQSHTFANGVVAVRYARA